MLAPTSTLKMRQKGVVLIITLIVLVAMTLAVIALVRSVDTSNIIAGNLAFQQSAKESADAGADHAVGTLLKQVVIGGNLNCDLNCPQGYYSWRQPLQEPPYGTWSSYWSGVQNHALVLPKDALGNTVSYIVERMCSLNGDANSCLKSAPLIPDCSGNDPTKPDLPCPAAQLNYFRIITKVEGPRNTVSYTQTIYTM